MTTELDNNLAALWQIVRNHIQEATTTEFAQVSKSKAQGEAPIGELAEPMGVGKGQRVDWNSREHGTSTTPESPNAVEEARDVHESEEKGFFRSLFQRWFHR